MGVGTIRKEKLCWCNIGRNLRLAPTCSTFNISFGKQKNWCVEWNTRGRHVIKMQKLWKEAQSNCLIGKCIGQLLQHWIPLHCSIARSLCGSIYILVNITLCLRYSTKNNTTFSNKLSMLLILQVLLFIIVCITCVHQVLFPGITGMSWIIFPAPRTVWFLSQLFAYLCLPCQLSRQPSIMPSPWRVVTSRGLSHPGMDLEDCRPNSQEC